MGEEIAVLAVEVGQPTQERDEGFGQVPRDGGAGFVPPVSGLRSTAIQRVEQHLLVIPAKGNDRQARRRRGEQRENPGTPRIGTDHVTHMDQHGMCARSSGEIAADRRVHRP